MARRRSWAKHREYQQFSPARKISFFSPLHICFCLTLFLFFLFLKFGF
jgi:hypothetical protein